MTENREIILKMYWTIRYSCDTLKLGDEDGRVSDKLYGCSGNISEKLKI